MSHDVAIWLVPGSRLPIQQPQLSDEGKVVLASLRCQTPSMRRFAPVPEKEANWRANLAITIRVAAAAAVSAAIVVILLGADDSTLASLGHCGVPFGKRDFIRTI